MKSGRPIDISRSSLVSLKAELSRKQEEVDKAKSCGPYIKPTPKVKIIPKSNPGVAERNKNDIELTEEEVDQMKKSREVLELKAQLYEKLQSGKLIQESGASEYLVNFKEKNSFENEDFSELKEDKSDECENNSDSDSEWIEYTDCLGRTRKCHKEDWQSAKQQDEELSSKLYGKKPELMCDASERPETELVSNDMHKEFLRQKWEEQERKLMGKEKVFYEDVRFDEARSHGVGYYQFSTEEGVRETQQEEFRKAREETERRQEEAKALRERRDRQKQARLIAARQRQRARLGLPPIDTNHQEENVVESVVEENVTKSPIKEDLEDALKRAAHVRPWDAGKDGAQSKVMSQEEWVESRRQLRPSEFAPSYIEDMRKGFPSDQETSIPTGLAKNRKRLHAYSVSDYHKTENDPTTNDELKEEIGPGHLSQTHQNNKKGVEIPPPLSFDYYNSNTSKKAYSVKQQSIESTEEAIEAGLRILREQVEKKNSTKSRGLLDDL